jgi:diadenosine tetraphosphate (Ap4A) HIT family hydrolase
MENCVFCSFQNDPYGQVIFEDNYCLCIEMNEKVLVGSCIIIPKEHRETMFDLSFDEWNSTREMISMAKKYIDEKHSPQGYNIGWNVGAVGGQEVFHAHLHVIPRYCDEPFAGKGIRYWLKQEYNLRKQ